MDIKRLTAILEDSCNIRHKGIKAYCRLSGVFLIIYFLIASAFPQYSYSLEIFLNKNRSESGTIGFVDIDRVFREYSGTAASKNELDQELRRKEAEIERRKNVIYKLKAKSAKLRQEKELATVLPEMLESRKKIEEAQEQLRQDAEKVNQEKEQLQKEGNSVRQQMLEKEKQDFIIQAKQNGIPEEAIQEMLKEKFSQNETDSKATPEEKRDKDIDDEKAKERKYKAAKEKKDREINKDDGKPEIAAYNSVPMPEIARSKYRSQDEDNAPANLFTINIPGIGDFSFSVSTEPAKINEEITRIENRIKQDEESLKAYELTAEKELSEYEEAQTKQLLGKIYNAMQKLAQQEEISVVADKRNILYGKKTSDLTQKLLNLLEEPEDE